LLCGRVHLNIVLHDFPAFIPVQVAANSVFCMDSKKTDKYPAGT
jgi:hypothetical protein